MYLTKRQKEILDYIGTYIEQNGYAPTLEEMGAFFGLSSPATVYKHVQQLVEKGYLRKARHQGRGLELVARGPSRSIEVPILGQLRLGHPLEGAGRAQTVDLPATFASDLPLFALRVRGDGLAPARMQDGDLLILEDRFSVTEGETVVAVIPGDTVTVGRYFRRDGGISLQRSESASDTLWVAEARLRIRGVVVGLLRLYGPTSPAR